jgi:hypothetical protein
MTKLACFAVAMPTLIIGVGWLVNGYVSSRRRPVAAR